MRISIFPSKADTPLIVDSYAVLSRAIGLQGFKPVSRRRPQVIQSACAGQQFQFSAGAPFNRSKPSNRLISRQALGIGASKALYHSSKRLYCIS
jgi:hypothetical protein